MIVKNYKFLGGSVYKKTLLTEETLALEFDKVHCDDIGLYAIGKNPRLEYNNIAFFEDTNWKWLALRTLRLTILNLVNNRTIDIVKYSYSETFLFSLFKREFVRFGFQVVDLNTDEDLFTQLVFDAINEVNKTKHSSLFNYLKTLNNTLLSKHKSYNNPSRAFVIKVIEKYVTRYPWLEISEKKKLLGVRKDYNVEINEIYIPRIHMQHSLLIELDTHLYHNNKSYQEFCDSFDKAIRADFTRREPDDSDID